MLWTWFSFRGRIGRRTFWWEGVGPIFILSVLLGALLWVWIALVYPGIAVLRLGSSWADAALLLALPVLLVLEAALLWACLAVLAKRLHDMRASGWWAALILVPGWLPFVVVLLGIARGASPTRSAGPRPDTSERHGRPGPRPPADRCPPPPPPPGPQRPN